MHMSDALISTPVAVTAGVAAATLIAIAGNKLKKEKKEGMIPLMGVAGAFVFAAQMINFSIPGTGSSGHIVGGVLLAAMLGPWAGFLTLASVLIIQCLVFADGGLLALGCNILNMGAMTALVAYPLVFKPLTSFPTSNAKIMGVSVLACVVGLEAGAVAVTIETMLSGVTALPALDFLALMTGIHLAIGIGEGLATGAVLCFVQKARPALLYQSAPRETKRQRRKFVITLAVMAMLIGGVLAFFASSDPDGLEWSIMNLTGSTELPASGNVISGTAESIQNTTAIIPDYDNTFAGIIGAAMVMVTVWVISSLILAGKKRTATAKNEQA